MKKPGPASQRNSCLKKDILLVYILLYIYCMYVCTATSGAVRRSEHLPVTPTRKRHVSCPTLSMPSWICLLTCTIMLAVWKHEPLFLVPTQSSSFLTLHTLFSGVSHPLQFWATVLKLEGALKCVEFRSFHTDCLPQPKSKAFATAMR